MEKSDAEARWKERYEAQGERRERFATISGVPIKALYTARDVEKLDYERDLGYPGAAPFTRGVYPTMYRGRTWTKRQFSGFGTARDTNERFKYLLREGQTGLSVAFDFPTLYGRDSDDPLSVGEVGRCGVAIDTLADFETLFDGIPLDEVSTSMTINPPAAVMLCMYLAVGKKTGVAPDKLRGTIQNDMFKEFHAQNTWIYPPRAHARIIADIFAFAHDAMPNFNTVSISGYHIREAGSTAAQELAFTLADGFAYVELGRKSGLAVDDFAPRLTLYFNAHIDLFEEIAKYRAARRIWARTLAERYGARDERSLRGKFHVQTAGCSLAAQQPEVNIIRTAYEALGAVLGGTQSLHTNSYDEALQLPSEKAVRLAVRTQQVIEEETGVADTIDPLAGSYFVEHLTNEMERRANDYFDTILDMGNGSFLDGVIEGIETGYFRREIANASYAFQERVERGEFAYVGVNKYETDETPEVPPFAIGPEAEREQAESLARAKAARDESACAAALDELKRVAASDENLVPAVYACVERYCTEGEIMGAMREVFGEFRELKAF